MKFGARVHTQLSGALEIVDRVRENCSRSGRLLAATLNEQTTGGSSFMVTALEFSKINYETISGLKYSIQDGYTAQSFVVLRWHLELAHLFYYLWREPDAFTQWVAGKEIMPKTVRNYLKDNNCAPWAETYKDWSNVVHGNEKIVRSFSDIARNTPVSETQIVLAGHTYRNLMFTGHKMNMVTLSLLKEIAEVSDYNLIAKHFNSTEEDIWHYSNAQNEWEQKTLGGLEE